MDIEQFEAELARDGFTRAVAGEYEPGRINLEHTHPFEVRGLVLSGQMLIRGGEQVQRCHAGDVFVMQLGQTHREEVGPSGVRYLYGSRAAAT